MGMNPEEVLTRKALCEPHRIYATNQEREEDQIRALCLTFKETLKNELAFSNQSRRNERLTTEKK